MKYKVTLGNEVSPIIGIGSSMIEVFLDLLKSYKGIAKI